MSRGGAAKPASVAEWSPVGLRMADGRVLAQGTVGLASPALVALPRRSVFVRAVRVPNVSEEVVRQALQYQVAQLFPVPAQDLAWDFALGTHHDAEGRSASLFAVPNATLQQLTEDLQARGLKPYAIVPVALGSMVIASRLDLASCAVVERLPEGYGIDLIHEGVVRASRTVADDADLPVEVSLAMAAANVPSGPVVGAGGLGGPGIDRTTELGVLEALATPEALELDLHLEHPERAAERARRKTRARVRQAAMLAAATAVLWTAIGLDISDRAAARAQAEARWNARLAKLRKERSSLEARFATARRLSNALDRAFEPAQRVSDVALVVAEAVPPSAWLTGFTVERGRPASLRGSALDNESVGSLVRSLTSNGRFREVRLLFANRMEVEETPVVQFSVGAHVVGNLPLLSAEKTVRGRAAR
ncbi:MAG: PilN domain-containing protein [Fimbriimonadales bacterium]|nr:PilN domain-containing protein [Fimbriimonadales bacterium]